MTRLHARLVALAMGAMASLANAAPADEQRLIELQHTVENLLRALVDKGVMTREQAELLVANAQTKAQTETAAALAEQKAVEERDAGAVRVPYVPQIVRDEIKKEVLTDLTPQVTNQAVAEAISNDALVRALPDWVRRMRWNGDLRLRGQSDTFAADNLPFTYTDVLAVNDKGGFTKAGIAQFANTTEDRQRLRMRARLGFDVELGYGWTAGARLTTGNNLRDAVSTNQTMGNYGGRYTVGFDQAWLRWSGTNRTNRQSLTLTGGRLANPWLSSDLVWDQDLMFEGVTGNYRYSFSRDDAFARNWFFTAGAFPLQELELSNKDKWLFGGQTGLDWKTLGGNRYRLGVAYYDYLNISGTRNAFNSTLLDYTAPTFVQRGNTLFDIHNDNNTTNLMALAGEYRLVDVTANLDFPIGTAHRLSLNADVVENIGFDKADVFARSALDVEERTRGYQGELAFGSARFNERHAWRASIAYRYLEQDAVLDAFTDSDFRLGGTDVKGFIIGLDFAFSPRAYTRLRYLSGNEIDGLPFGVDMLQLDMNATF
ncbi:MAG TPA: putative porin [Steroidobacteraceae bacterium]|nr:putative porin [Steroidobacteraceae bacterium]